MRAFIRRFIIFSYDFWCYAHEAFPVFLSRPVDHSALFDTIDKLDAKKLALVAPHPREILPHSVRNLISSLDAAGFTIVVAVADERRAAWLKEEFPAIHFAPRPASGRDFGVWKSLLLSLFQNKSLMTKLDRLLLVNDSLFYNAKTSEVIDKLAKANESWGCLYENFQHHYHAQSFLLMFRNSAINDPAFSRFWRKYLPFSSRKHSIDNGEVGLSRALSKALGRPYCMLSSRQIVESLKDADRERLVGLVEMMTAHLDSSHKFGAEIGEIELLLGLVPLQGGTVFSEPEKVSGWAVHLSQMVMAKLMERQNPTHVAGLIANRIWGTPLKRDLAQRGNFQIADLLRFASFYTEDELVEMERDLRAKALPGSIRGIKRLLFDQGRI